MKVTIIIPAYNEADSIGSCLTAVLAQNYPDLEIIVVDNASTDATAEIAGRFGVKVLHEPNKGTQWAMERGRHEAKGEIIARLDADCLPATDWISKGVAAFSNPRVVAVSGPYDYYDGSPFFRYSQLYMQKVIFRSVSILAQWLRLGALMLGGNSFMRSSTLEKIGGFDTSIVFWGDDVDIAKRLAREGQVIFNNSLALKSSARRFKNQGTIRLTVTYLFHYFKTLFASSKK